MSEIVQLKITPTPTEENPNKYNFGYLHHQQRLYRVFEELSEMHEELDEEDRENAHIVSLAINSYCRLQMWEDYDDAKYNYAICYETDTLFQVEVNRFKPTEEEYICEDADIEHLFKVFYKKFSTQYNFDETQEFIVYKCEHCTDTYSDEVGICKYCFIKQVTLQEPCPICLEAGQAVWKRLHKCSHIFHAKCLNKIKKQSFGQEFQCPLCRTNNLFNMAKII